MIVIDTSALVSLLLGEREAERFALAIQNDEEPILSAASWVELVLVMKHKQGPTTKDIVNELVKKAGIRIAAVTEDQASIANEAAHSFSVLNYGDTFSYALAKDSDAPLLFKGNDFSQTDIKISPY